MKTKKTKQVEHFFPQIQVKTKINKTKKKVFIKNRTLFPQIQVKTKITKIKKVFHKNRTLFFPNLYAQMYTHLNYWGECSEIIGGYISPIPPSFGTPAEKNLFLLYARLAARLEDFMSLRSLLSALFGIYTCVVLRLFFILCVLIAVKNKFTLLYLTCSAEVESRTQGSRPRPRTQKKSKAKAKDSLSEDRTSRGQGQECSRPRPRTKDTGASVLQKKKKKKKVFKNFFQAISNLLAYSEFLIGGVLNYKSHEMTSLNFFKEEVFVGQRYRRMEDLKSLLPVCT